MLSVDFALTNSNVPYGTCTEHCPLWGKPNIPEEREILSCPGNGLCWAPCWGGQTEQGREIIFLLPPTLYLLPQEVRKKPGFQTRCSTFAPIHIWWIIFQNHHKWTKPWINILKTIQIIHLLTGPTQQSPFMNNYTGATPGDYLQFRPIVALTLPKFYLLCQQQEPGVIYRQPTVKGASKEDFWDVGSPGQAGIIPLLEAKTHSTILLLNVFQLLHPLRSIISKYI